MSAYTRAGLKKVRPAGPGSRVRLLAPASGFERAEFLKGVEELRRLGFEPVYDDRIFERHRYVAGTAESRAAQLREAWADPSVDAILAIRGGYGSVQMLPLLDAGDVGSAALIGYSDVTSLHVWVTGLAARASVHGPMIDRKLSAGPDAYDARTFLGSLRPEPLGELAPDGLEALRVGEAGGPLFGGTISQLLGSLATPFAFAPPVDAVLFLDEVGERPYRLDRMLTQLRQTGILSRASAIVVGQLPGCDEPDGRVTGREVCAEALADFHGPVLLGFPSGHTTTTLVSLPLGAWTTVVADHRPRLIIEESIVMGNGR